MSTAKTKQIRANQIGGNIKRGLLLFQGTEKEHLCKQPRDVAV